MASRLEPSTTPPPATPADGPTFHTGRRDDVHSVRPWSQFAYVAKKLEELVAGFVQDLPLGASPRVLDYGCADLPYRALLPAATEYLAADLPGNPAATLELRPDGTVPVEPGSIDVVLSTQVLEHVRDPATYLAESWRVLRSGGALVLTTHGIMYYHRDPEDYWRWTCDGLRSVVADAGFEVRRVAGVLGLAAAALQLFQDGTHPYVPRRLQAPYAFVMQRLIAFADRRYTDETRVLNGLVLGVVAVKP